MTVADNEELIASSVMYRVGGRFYPMVVSPTCRTCQSPYRSYIENQILCGYTYRQISDSLPEDLRLSPRQMSDHYRHGHMPLAEAARRAIVEKRAAEKQLDSVNGLDNLVDHITVLEAIVRDGSDLLARREIQPTVKELMAAADALAQLEAAGDTADDWDAVNKGIQHVMKMARARMTPAEFALFSRDLVTDPYLKRLMDGNVLDAELVPAELVENISEQRRQAD
jgi:hypothetical protein